MAYVVHEVNALISVDPEKAKSRILTALKKSKWHKEDAAKILDCNYVTLLRWITRLRLEKKIASETKFAKKAGTFHDRKGGRPLGSTVANGAKTPKKRAKPV